MSYVRCGRERGREFYNLLNKYNNSISNSTIITANNTYCYFYQQQQQQQGMKNGNQLTQTFAQQFLQ